MGLSRTASDLPSAPWLHRGIWYMGAKTRILRDFLGRVLEDELRAGDTVLDLMCGSGVVAAFCANRYRVFANDAQAYAASIARSLLEHEPETKTAFLESLDFESDLSAAYRANLETLRRAYGPALGVEADLLARFRSGRGRGRWAGDYRRFLEAAGAQYATGGDPPAGSPFRRARGLVSEKSIRERRREPSVRPACLVTAYYANVYYGLRQAVELDSIRAAIDDIDPVDPFRDEKRVYYLGVLLHAASVTTSGTSHFAQPRHLTKDSELAAMAKRRELDIRSVFEEYMREVSTTIYRTCHRRGNRVFNVDYRDLLDGKGKFRLPSRAHLVYLDPPYTADHYSRFYHVLETISRYDYPELGRSSDGTVLRGRYPARTNRFQSGFCRQTTVEDEFRRVAHGAAMAGAKLVISYSWPSGLLFKRYLAQGRGAALGKLESLCREAYGDVRTLSRSMTHSGQGDSNIRIEELLVVCK